MIKEAGRKRSLPQNSLYWTWLGILSADTGFSTEDLHNYFKVDILGLKELRHRGRTVAVPNSTKTLSTEEFTEYMDEVQARAAAQGIVLPYKNFFGYEG